MVLSYTTSPAYHVVVDEDSTKKAAAFAEGHYMQIEVAARLAESDHPELAQQFLDFMTSQSFQAILPATNWMYPAYDAGDAVPDAFGDLIEPSEALIFAPEEVPEIRENAMAEWLDALSR